MYMTKKITLRIPEGYQLGEDEFIEIQKVLKTDDIAKITYSTNRDEKSIYLERITTFYDAFNCLVDAYPPTANFTKGSELKDYAKYCYGLANEQLSEDFETNHEVLQHFTQQLVAKIAGAWHVNGHDSVEMLNKTEQYMVLLKEQHEIATLNEMKINGHTYYTLQYDKHLSSLTPEFKEEVLLLQRQANSLNIGWFQQLNHQEQQFLINSPSIGACKVMLKDLVIAFHGLAKETYQQTNAYQKLNKTQQQIINKMANSDDERFSRKIQKFLDALDRIPSFEANGRKVDTEFLELQKNKENITKSPLWYKSLSPYEKGLFVYAITQGIPIEKLFSFVSSKHRTLPLLPNLAINYLHLFDGKFNLVKSYYPSYRSSHLASRDVRKLKHKDELQKLHVDRNLEHLLRVTLPDTKKAQKEKYGFELGEIPLLFQTLISPTWLGSGFVPDYYIDKKKNEGISRLKNSDKHTSVLPLEHNHPLNVYGIFQYTSAYNSQSQLLIGTVDERINSLARILTDAVDVKLGKKELAFDAYINSQCERLIIQSSHGISKKSIGKVAIPYDKFGSLVLTDMQIQAMVLQIVSAYQDQLLASSNTEYLSTKFKIIPTFNVSLIPDVGSPYESIIMQAMAHLTTALADNRAEFKQLNDKTLTSLVTNALKVISSRNRISNPELVDSAMMPLLTQHQELVALKREYKNTLNSNFGTATFKNSRRRELFLSSLEQLMAQHLDGICYGSCVSGKDRKAIEILHTRSMLLYHDFYGAWPKFSDYPKERERFVSIFARLYVTWHQQERAAKSAPGAHGIKNASTYLPDDVCEEVIRLAGDNIMSIEDGHASTNEVKYIVPSLDRNYMDKQLLLTKVLLIDEPERIKLINTVRTIIDDVRFWERKGSGFISTFLPKGISDLRTFMILDKQKSFNTKDDLTNILGIITERKNAYTSSYTRNDDTRILYSALMKLTSVENPKTVINDVLFALNMLSLKVRNKNANQFSIKVNALDNPKKLALLVTDILSNEGWGKQAPSEIKILQDAIKNLDVQYNYKLILANLYETVLLEYLKPKDTFQDAHVNNFYLNMLTLVKAENPNEVMPRISKELKALNVLLGESLPDHTMDESFSMM
jgi:hypothetical protein